MQITKQAGFARVSRTRDGVVNALSLLLRDSYEKIQKGESIIIGHLEYSKMKGENLDEVIVAGKYQRNSPKYREVRNFNRIHGFDGDKRGGKTGFTAVSVIVNDEKTAKEVGLNIGDYAFQITKLG